MNVRVFILYFRNGSSVGHIWHFGIVQNSYFFYDYNTIDILYKKASVSRLLIFLKFQSINQLMIKCPSGPIGFYKIGSWNVIQKLDLR